MFVEHCAFVSFCKECMHVERLCMHVERLCMHVIAFGDAEKIDTYKQQSTSVARYDATGYQLTMYHALGNQP